MVPGIAGKRMDVPDTYEATWPAVPTATVATVATVATATVAETTPVVAPAVATAIETVGAVSLEEVLDRLRAKHTLLSEEHRTLILIETQLALNQTLKDEIAHKRKVLENPECQ